MLGEVALGRGCLPLGVGRAAEDVEVAVGRGREAVQPPRGQHLPRVFVRSLTRNL